jgi:hypothetical protein
VIKNLVENAVNDREAWFEGFPLGVIYLYGWPMVKAFEADGLEKRGFF